MALFILHMALHVLVPGLAAWFFFRGRWRRAWLVMLATMAVDLDHLIADPVFDPGRCGIGLHPLHEPAAIAVYGLFFIIPRLRLVGLGLLIHMALDFLDCLRM